MVYLVQCGSVASWGFFYKEEENKRKGGEKVTINKIK